jgi:hypothetical protein
VIRWSLGLSPRPSRCLRILIYRRVNYLGFNRLLLILPHSLPLSLYRSV